MNQIGKIISIEDKMATVELERSSACAKCGICHLGETQILHIDVENSINAQVGQRVLIAVGQGSVLKASSILYLIPLLALVGGIGLAYLLERLIGLPGNADWWGIGFGLTLFFLAYVIIRLQEPALRSNPAYAPRMLRLAGEQEDISNLCGKVDE
ncbi:MAG: SoxR reducing system RseC family protein [Eubacteriales bacterium]|nr:SoxR reducing system RseC family protein [Eubacteriales bacterium]